MLIWRVTEGFLEEEKRLDIVRQLSAPASTGPVH